MPTLSIITINLNNFIGLKNTIESVLQQTSSDFEYIIIDGGSSDGSIELIKDYEKNITYWVSETDRGIYNAMNKGIRNAKGKYCQFINSGDFLVSNTVTEKMIASIDHIAIHIGNMIKVFPNGIITLDKGWEKNNISFRNFYFGSLNHSPAYIPLVYFSKYGLYDEKLNIVADWKWFMIVVGLNNEPVFYHNIDMTIFDMTGISNSNFKRVKIERRKVLNEQIPNRILKDYDRYAWFIIFIFKIQQFGITRELLKRLRLKFLMGKNKQLNIYRT